MNVKAIFFLLLLVTVVCVVLIKQRPAKLQRIEKDSYNLAYSIKYKETKNELKEKIDEVHNKYNLILDNQEKEYKKNKAEAEKKGLLEGKKVKLSETQKEISEEANENEKNKKWDSVLYKRK